MSDEAKVTLSAGELAMANDKNIILIKHAVTDKAFSLFGSMVPLITNEFEPALNRHSKLSGAIPKIFKGENYLGLPFVMMDYPAVFEKDNIFAVRTMFWWGNFISITLHLSGIHKNYWENNLLKKVETQPDIFITVGEDEWQHYFKEDNYLAFSLLSTEQQKNIREKNFLKVSLKHELHHWNMMQSILPVGYKTIADLLLF